MKLELEQLLGALAFPEVYEVVIVRLAGIIGVGICIGLLLHDAFEGFCLLLLDVLRLLRRLAKRFIRSGHSEKEG